MSASAHRGVMTGSRLARRTNSGEPLATLPRIPRSGFAHVLVLGGNDEQRDFVARTYHAESPVRQGPFVRVDCRADEPRLEAALRCWLSCSNARSAENPLRAVERGTLFLDHIESLSAGAQRRLLEFVRCIADGSCPSWAGRLTTGSSVALDDGVSGGDFSPPLFDCLDKVRVALGVSSPGVAA